MAFHRLTLNSEGSQPEACLTFTLSLSDNSEIKYADYLKFQPAAKPSFKISGNQLCLGGLSFGRDYKVTIASGFPAAVGTKTEKAETWGFLAEGVGFEPTEAVRLLRFSRPVH